MSYMAKDLRNKLLEDYKRNLLTAIGHFYVNPTVKFTVTVVQEPEESTEKFVKRVQREIKRTRRRNDLS